jgi:hypothetical protein
MLLCFASPSSCMCENSVCGVDSVVCVCLRVGGWSLRLGGVAACALRCSLRGRLRAVFQIFTFHLCPVAAKKKSVKDVEPRPSAAQLALHPTRRHSRGLKHRENHAKFKGMVGMHGIYLSVCLYAWYEFPSACPLGLPKGAAALQALSPPLTVCAQPLGRAPPHIVEMWRARRK